MSQPPERSHPMTRVPVSGFEGVSAQDPADFFQPFGTVTDVRSHPDDPSLVPMDYKKQKVSQRLVPESNGGRAQNRAASVSYAAAASNGRKNSPQNNRSNHLGNLVGNGSSAAYGSRKSLKPLSKSSPPKRQIRGKNRPPSSTISVSTSTSKPTHPPIVSPLKNSSPSTSRGTPSPTKPPVPSTSNSNLPLRRNRGPIIVPRSSADNSLRSELVATKVLHINCQKISSETTKKEDIHQAIVRAGVLPPTGQVNRVLLLNKTMGFVEFDSVETARYVFSSEKKVSLCGSVIQWNPSQRETIIDVERERTTFSLPDDEPQPPREHSASSLESCPPVPAAPTQSPPMPVKVNGTASESKSKMIQSTPVMPIPSMVQSQGVIRELQGFYQSVPGQFDRFGPVPIPPKLQTKLTKIACQMELTPESIGLFVGVNTTYGVVSLEQFSQPNVWVKQAALFAKHGSGSSSDMPNHSPLANRPNNRSGSGTTAATPTGSMTQAGTGSSSNAESTPSLSNGNSMRAPVTVPGASMPMAQSLVHTPMFHGNGGHPHHVLHPPPGHPHGPHHTMVPNLHSQPNTQQISLPNPGGPHSIPMQQFMPHLPPGPRMMQNVIGLRSGHLPTGHSGPPSQIMVSMINPPTGPQPQSHVPMPNGAGDGTNSPPPFYGRPQPNIGPAGNLSVPNLIGTPFPFLPFQPPHLHGMAESGTASVRLSMSNTASSIDSTNHDPGQNSMHNRSHHSSSNSHSNPRFSDRLDSRDRDRDRDGCVVMLSNLNPDYIDCDKLFNLVGVYADVTRVKISFHKREQAFIQVRKSENAQVAVKNLKGLKLFGRNLFATLSRMPHVKMPKDDGGSASVSSGSHLLTSTSSSTPSGVMEDEGYHGRFHHHDSHSSKAASQVASSEAHLLTRDYSESPFHRFARPNSKYSHSVGAPSAILHLSNLPDDTNVDELREYLGGVERVEVIEMNTKHRGQAFAKCRDVETAVIILMDYHNTKFGTREIRISFATRNHMPSDLRNDNGSQGGIGMHFDHDHMHVRDHHYSHVRNHHYSGGYSSSMPNHLSGGSGYMGRGMGHRRHRMHGPTHKYVKKAKQNETTANGTGKTANGSEKKDDGAVSAPAAGGTASSSST